MDMSGNSSSATRNNLRAKILAERAKKVVVTLDGMDIEVRQMTVGQALDTTNLEDDRKRMARYLVDCCYVPGTDEKIFEEADLDVLMDMPAGGYYTKIMEAVTAQMLPKQLEVAKK
jgi:hypothetical protein